ncbi:sigma factor [Nonomuraea sp. NPDC049129]|uniref:RNA polymerase sigma factor n=1 Tax=Nonomuraea sp. NPDC049129 TaxID=3155272 RepID=UPI0033CBE4B5
MYHTRSGRDQPAVPADLFDRYFAEIHRYIARRLPTDDADDLAAEVFLAALRGRYDPAVGEVRPWLYGIATNLDSPTSRLTRVEAKGGLRTT